MIKLFGGTVLDYRDGHMTTCQQDLFFDESLNLIVASPAGNVDLDSITSIDCSGCYLAPGFVDTHIHGAFGFDTSDAEAGNIVELARRLPEFGVAAFMPTTMTIEKDRIYKTFEAVSEAVRELDEGDKQETSANAAYASILGIHLEGPFLSPVMSGVQKSCNLLTPREGMTLIDDLEAKFPGLMRIIDIAPELDGSDEFVERYHEKYVLSIAHSDCDYEEASQFFANGGKSVTHLLNAMRPCLKREPGVLGAAFDSGAFVEVICDGFHIDRSVLRMIFALFDGRVVAISDAMRGAGMPDGEYSLGGTMVTVREGRTFYGEGGNLAGSVCNLGRECEVLVQCGVPIDKVIDSLSFAPYRRLGLEAPRLVPGQVANINVIDCEGRLQRIISRGNV